MAVSPKPKRPRKIGFGSALKPPSVPRPVAPAKSPAPKAPTPVAVPSLLAQPAAQGGPPALSAEGETARIAARQGYGVTMNDVNRQMRDLATAFGGVGDVQQFGYAPGADPRSIGTDTSSKLGGILTFDPSNPSNDQYGRAAYQRSLGQNNAMASLYRNMFEAQDFDRQKHTADNTFFSGMTLSDLDKEKTAHDRGVTQATTDYQSALANLSSQLSGAQVNRNQSIGQANDAEAAAEAARRAAAEAQAAPPPPPTVAPASFASNVAAYQAYRRRNPLGIWGR